MHCRPLAPGQYQVYAAFPGFKNETSSVTVPADGRGALHNFVLQCNGSCSATVTALQSAIEVRRIACHG